MIRAPLSDIDFNTIGPRPSTPPRRRPRIHGLNNSVSISSRLSAADSWVTVLEDRLSAEFAGDHNLIQQVTPLRVVQSVDVIGGKKDPSKHMLPPTFVRPDRAVRQALQNPHQPHSGRPQPIYGRPQPIYTLGRNSLTDSSSDTRECDGDEIVSLQEALNPTPSVVQHRVATDRYGQLVIDTIMEHPEEQPVSAPERKHAQGNFDAGYGSRDYVTDLQAKGPKTKMKSNNVFKRMFCL